MYFVSITRLRIRRWRFLPAFFYFTLRSYVQSRRADGNLVTLLERDARLVFWTITVWRDAASMRQFRNRGQHLKAMPRLREWCDEATYAHWSQQSPEPPTLEEAFARLVSDGVVSRVLHPSPDHERLTFPQPRT